MLDAVKERDRDLCRRAYHIAVKHGYFLVARMMLRKALVWRSPEARLRSVTWGYKVRDAKLESFKYRWTY